MERSISYCHHLPSLRIPLWLYLLFLPCLTHSLHPSPLSHWQSPKRNGWTVYLPLLHGVFECPICWRKRRGQRYHMAFCMKRIAFMAPKKSKPILSPRTPCPLLPNLYLSILLISRVFVCACVPGRSPRKMLAFGFQILSIPKKGGRGLNHGFYFDLLMDVLSRDLSCAIKSEAKETPSSPSSFVKL